MSFTVQTSGTTSDPVTESLSGSSPCVSYSPALCFQASTVGDVTSVQYETSWTGTCLGGERDVIVTACLNAADRSISAHGNGAPGALQCIVEDPITDGPKVRYLFDSPAPPAFR